MCMSCIEKGGKEERWKVGRKKNAKPKFMVWLGPPQCPKKPVEISILLSLRSCAPWNTGRNTDHAGMASGLKIKEAAPTVSCSEQ